MRKELKCDTCDNPIQEKADLLMKKTEKNNLMSPKPQNKKAPYWLSALSVFCMMCSFTFGGFYLSGLMFESWSFLNFVTALLSIAFLLIGGVFLAVTYGGD